MSDSKILHFLRNFPAWVVLVTLTVVFVLLFYRTGDASYKEWTSLILASLFTALGVQRQITPTANTNSGDVNVSTTEPVSILPPESQSENKTEGQ